MVTPALKQLFAERNIQVIPVDVGSLILAHELEPANQGVVQTVVGGPLFYAQNEQDSTLRSYRIHRLLSMDSQPLPARPRYWRAARAAHGQRHRLDE